MKILVVEDNPSDANLLRQAFRELNSRASIVVARDGDECIRLLHGEQVGREDLPDLIFLDLQLPTLSGYEVLRRVKADTRTRHIPVIVLSSARANSDIERVYREHANAYVQKPASLEDLMTAARGLKTFWMDTARLASSFVGT